MKDESKPGVGKPKSGDGKLVAGKTGAVRKRPVSAGPTASVEAAVAKITPARLAAFEILKLVLINY